MLDLLHLLQFKHLPGKHNQKLHGRKGTSIPVNAETKAAVLAKVARYDSVMVAAAYANIKAVIADSPLTIRVPEDILGKIIDTGYMLNQHSTGTSGGTLDPNYRAAGERNAFGTHLSKPEDFPIYGYLNTDNNGFNTDEELARYGQVRIVLKPEVRKRTTITVGDSLELFEQRQAVGTPLLNPGKEVVDGKADDLAKIPPDFSEFIEAQIHGGVRVSDIAEIKLPKPVSMDEEHKTLLAKLDQNGLNWSYM